MALLRELAALRRDLRREYERHIRAAGNEPRLIGAGLFLVTFSAIRIVTHAIHGGVGPFFNIEPGGVHVHHMIPGLVLLLLSGLLDLSGHAVRTRAVLFGVGAALVLDEFALILNLADVYWEPQGRESIDAVVIMAAALVVIALGGGFWRAAYGVMTRHLHRAATPV
jgi:hypothetical protein